MKRSRKSPALGEPSGENRRITNFFNSIVITYLSRKSYIALTLTIPLGLACYVLAAGPRNAKTTDLEPGKSLPMVSVVRIPIAGVAAEDDIWLVVRTFYDRFFAFPGTVHKGKGEFPLTLGTEADKDQIFTLSVIRTPANSGIKPRMPLDEPLQGKVIYGPTRHRRL